MIPDRQYITESRIIHPAFCFFCKKSANTPCISRGKQQRTTAFSCKPAAFLINYKKMTGTVQTVFSLTGTRNGGKNHEYR